MIKYNIEDILLDDNNLQDTVGKNFHFYQHYLFSIYEEILKITGDKCNLELDENIDYKAFDEALETILQDKPKDLALFYSFLYLYNPNLFLKHFSEKEDLYTKCIQRLKDADFVTIDISDIQKFYKRVIDINEKPSVNDNSPRSVVKRRVFSNKSSTSEEDITLQSVVSLLEHAYLTYDSKLSEYFKKTNMISLEYDLKNASTKISDLIYENVPIMQFQSYHDSNNFKNFSNLSVQGHYNIKANPAIRDINGEKYETLELSSMGSKFYIAIDCVTDISKYKNEIKNLGFDRGIDISQKLALEKKLDDLTSKSRDDLPPLFFALRINMPLKTQTMRYDKKGRPSSVSNEDYVIKMIDSDIEKLVQEFDDYLNKNDVFKQLFLGEKKQVSDLIEENNIEIKSNSKSSTKTVSL